MRAFLLAFCLATAAAMVAAQDPGDLVSSTRCVKREIPPLLLPDGSLTLFISSPPLWRDHYSANGIIITGSIDEDGDTVGL